MNSNELNYAMAKMLGINSKDFRGVFASNQIPSKTLRAPFGFIVNNEPSNLPGQHWVAFFKGHENGPLLFFDSYGLKARTISKHFKRFLDSKELIIQNKIPFQNINTDICGQYCLYFLYHCFKGFSFAEILSTFPVANCSPLNDNVVCKFVSAFEPFIDISNSDSVQCSCVYVK